MSVQRRQLIESGRQSIVPPRPSRTNGIMSTASGVSDSRSDLEASLPGGDVGFTPRDTAPTDAHRLRERARFHLPVNRGDVERRALFDFPLVEQSI